MSLKAQSFNSIRWTSVASVSRTLLQVLQLAILARFLAPQDFGLIAITLSIVTILGLFSDLGLGKAIIHHPEITRRQLSGIYWLNVGAAFILTFITLCAAPLIAWLYDEYRLVHVLAVISLVFPLNAVGYQFRVLAEKNLHFSSLAMVEISANICGFFFAVGVALAGGGVWAIVTGMLVVATCASVFSWWRLSFGWRPQWKFKFSECRPFLRFGGYSMAETLVSTVRMQTDVFIGGMMFGAGSLGLYSLPRDLSLRIALTINPIVTRVGFPVMAKVQEDTTKLKSIYLQVLRMTASINFPIYVAFALFSQEIVVLLLGERWQGSATYLTIFSVFGLIRSIGNPVGSLLYAVGQAQRAFWWNLVLLFILPPLFFLGAYLGGLVGLALAVLAAQMAIFVPAWWFLVRPVCDAGFSEYFLQLVPPLLIALSAGGCAFMAAMPFDRGVVRLGLELVVGALVYIALSTRFNRPWVTAIRELLLMARWPLRRNIDSRIV